MNFRLIAYSANVLQAIRHIRFLNELKTALGSAAFIIYLIYIYYRGVWHEVHSVASGVLVQPHFGHFFPLTVPLDKSPSAILPCVALIENPTFFPDLTGFENLKLLSSIQNKIGDEEIIKTLDQVNLLSEKDKKYSEYSLGMKQKLGIAQVLMENPDVMIFDEPMKFLSKNFNFSKKQFR